MPAVGIGAVQQDERDTPVHLLEERLNHDRDIYELKIKTLEEKIDAHEKLIQEIDDKAQKRIDDSKEYYSTLLKFYTSGLAALIAILGFLGWKTISNWIKIRIQERVNEVMTQDFVKEIISEKGDPIIKQKIAQYDDLYNDYRLKFEDIERKNYRDTAKPLSEAAKKELEEFKKKLEAAKAEASYTADDWFLLGIEEFNKRNYVAAAEYFTKSAQLKLSPIALGNAALSYDRVKNHDEAEKYYKRALEIDPNYASALANYAVFLEYSRKDYENAEKYYKRALAADPNNANNLGNYALFLRKIYHNYDEAEKFHKRALEVDPNHANNLSNYGVFLESVYKDYDEAEKYYKRALEVDPNNADSLSNYAVLLTEIRKDYDEAEKYYKLALKVNPFHVNDLTNYAVFLYNVRRDYDEAETYYKRALEIDPNDVNSLANYAVLFAQIRKNYENAEKYYKHALEIDPNNADILGNYAGMLLLMDREDGFGHLEKAIERGFETEKKGLLLECFFYKYAHIKDEVSRKEALREMKKRIEAGDRSPGWDLSNNVEQAIADGHPEPELLKTLARVIADEEQADVLGQYPSWREA